MVLNGINLSLSITWYDYLTNLLKDINFMCPDTFLLLVTYIDLLYDNFEVTHMISLCWDSSNDMIVVSLEKGIL